jgi:hypothetical protein
MWQQLLIVRQLVQALLLLLLLLLVTLQMQLLWVPMMLAMMPTLLT